MALFHDPLDDLITGLERAIPADSGPVDQPSAPDDWSLVEIQMWAQVVLNGSEMERARARAAWAARLAARLNTPEARARLDAAHEARVRRRTSTRVQPTYPEDEHGDGGSDRT